MFFPVSCQFLDPTKWVYHFPRLSGLSPYSKSYSGCVPFPFFKVFSPYSRSYHVHFSLFTFFSVSCHIPGPTMWVSYFPCWIIVHFSLFTFFTVSCHNPVPTVYISHFSRFSVFLTIFQVLPWEFFILPCRSDFSQYSRSHSVCFSFSSFFQCFSSYSRSYNIYVSFSTFFSFPTILLVLQCLCLIFHRFECFSPYSRSYIGCVSISTF